MGKRRIEICQCGGAFVWLAKTPRARHVEKFNASRALLPKQGGLHEVTVYLPHVCRPPSERQVARRDVAQRLRELARQVETEP